MKPGIIPNLHSPGVIIPGQFGPIILMPSLSANSLTSNISKVGMPSVIQIINSIPLSIASIIEGLQNLAGTKIIVAFASVACFASFTELKTGRSKWVCPPLPGVTPPKILVPYSIA